MSTLYFFGANQPDGYLSNFYPSPFGDDKDPSICYKASEHYLMYQKALTFNDAATAQAILKASTPRKAKGLGRQVKNFDDEKWKKRREQIVIDGCMLKFRQHPRLKQQLLDTLDMELVEASPFDRVWGIGFRAGEAEWNRSEWGENLLGKCLTVLRRQLREEDTERKKP